MLNLALLNVGSPRMQTHETAVQLLHLLDTRFFQEPVFYTESTAEDVNTARLPLNDIFLSVSYCHAQMSLSEQLAKFHPEITLDMFSGEYVTALIEGCEGEGSEFIYAMCQVKNDGCVERE